MPRATVSSNDDLGASLGCLSVPLFLGDVLNAYCSHQTQDMSKPLVRYMGITLLQVKKTVWLVSWNPSCHLQL